MTSRIAPSDFSSGKRLARVLVVDDNEAAAKVLALVLSLHGYDAREAHNGMQALKIAQHFVPEIVLLDLGMPIMDGFDVARQIQSTVGLEDVTLVAVTGRSGSEWIESTREAGFHRHFVKTGEPEFLLRLIAEIVRTRSETGRGFDQRSLESR